MQFLPFQFCQQDWFGFQGNVFGWQSILISWIEISSFVLNIVVCNIFIVAITLKKSVAITTGNVKYL